MKSTASDLFDTGSKAMDESRWEDCRAAFLAAWGIHPSHQIAGNLAECEAKLGRHADAAEHLRFALREMPATVPAERRTRGEELLRELRPKVAEVSIRVSKPDAEVFVDGKSVGRSPLAMPLFVEPGNHAVEAKLAGAVTKGTVSAKGGGAHEVALAFEEAAPPRSTAPAYVIGGGGVASLIAGAVLFGMAEAGKSDIRRQTPRDGSGAPACAKPGADGATAAVCDELRAKGFTANTLGNASIAMFVLGGAAVAGAVAYRLWPEERQPASGRSARVLPVVSASGGGLVVTGAF
jgi:hypothetical protein